MDNLSIHRVIFPLHNYNSRKLKKKKHIQKKRKYAITKKQNCITRIRRHWKGIKVHVQSFKFHIWLNFFFFFILIFYLIIECTCIHMWVQKYFSGAGGQEFALLFLFYIVHILTFISMSRSKTNAEFFSISTKIQFFLLCFDELMNFLTACNYLTISIVRSK